MQKLDFLSGTPKTFIFEKSSNKTYLGGVFTLIYLIIVLIIFLVYIFDYEVNPKYEAQFSSEHFYNSDDEYIENKMEDEKLNPKLSFRFFLENKVDKSEFVIIKALPNLKKIEFGEEYESFANESCFFLGYICENTSCLPPQDELQQKLNMYEFIFEYSGYEINHQNETSPLEQKWIPNTYWISPLKDKYTFFGYNWKNIIYKEEKGLLGIFENLLGINNDHYGVEYINSLIYTPDKTEDIEKIEGLGLKIFAYIYPLFFTNEHYIDKYTRTKKSIWTSFANICSLSLTVYNGFIFVFCRFYSNNFDNYKIIEKILSKNNNKNINNNKMDNKKNINSNNNIMVELSDDFDKKNNLIEKDNNDLNNKESNDNKINKEKDDSDKFENNNVDNNNRYLPKLHFYDYFINNIYMKKCCSSNKQNIISACNEIILKLYSVDNILHNIIMLENLFKDYKWNDPNLNDIENNEMIKNLKSLI
jgi:hypothetical protein